MSPHASSRTHEPTAASESPLYVSIYLQLHATRTLVSLLEPHPPFPGRNTLCPSPLPLRIYNFGCHLPRPSRVHIIICHPPRLLFVLSYNQQAVKAPLVRVLALLYTSEYVFLRASSHNLNILSINQFLEWWRHLYIESFHRLPCTGTSPGPRKTYMAAKSKCLATRRRSKERFISYYYCRICMLMLLVSCIAETQKLTTCNVSVDQRVLCAMLLVLARFCLPSALLRVSYSTPLGKSVRRIKPGAAEVLFKVRGAS